MQFDQVGTIAGFVKGWASPCCLLGMMPMLSLRECGLSEIADGPGTLRGSIVTRRVERADLRGPGGDGRGQGHHAGG